MKRMVAFIGQEIFLVVSLALLFMFMVLFPQEIPNYPAFVDWKTIGSLAGLLVITTALGESGYINTISMELLRRLKTERELAIFFVLFSALISTFLTNDIALFVVVPLTLSIQRMMGSNLSKLIIFEAISVNVGSALTPIGNPQNLFLWHRWNISFMGFVFKMLPLVSILLLVLLGFMWITFSEKKVVCMFMDNVSQKQDRRSLFIFSMTMLILYVSFLKMGWSYYILPMLFVLYFIFFNDVLSKVDWFLLLFFVVIFIDFHIISTLPFIADIVDKLDLALSSNVFFLSLFLSQFVSNVPAGVFVSKFSHNWLAISYGVNVGGNGLVVSSLANLIALRLLRDRKAWVDFHRYSIPYFLLTSVLVYEIWFAG